LSTSDLEECVFPVRYELSNHQASRARAQCVRGVGASRRSMHSVAS